MKKLLLSIISVTLMFQSYAQKGEIQLGAKAGLNFATLTGDLDDAKGRTSFHLGGIAEIPMTDKLSIQPELLFSSQGATFDSDALSLNYINVPILAKYYVTEELSLEVGPYVGYLLSANIKYETEGDDLNPNTSGERSSTKASEKEDVKDDIKSLDFGLNVGLGYKMPSGLNFAARYVLGLANASDFENSSQEFKNGVFQISIGYFFL